jgi:hypothetical protein
MLGQLQGVCHPECRISARRWRTGRHIGGDSGQLGTLKCTLLLPIEFPPHQSGLFLPTLPA